MRGSPGDRVRTLQAVWANGFPQSAGTSEVSDAASGGQGGDGEVEEAGDAQATLARLAQELERLSDDFSTIRCQRFVAFLCVTKFRVYHDELTLKKIFVTHKFAKMRKKKNNAQIL